MNLRLISILTVAIALTHSACIIDFHDDYNYRCRSGSGPYETRALPIAPFAGISLQVPADVHLTQGPVREVVVEGRADIIAELRTRVRNDIWYIEFDRCVNDIGRLDIYITMPAVFFLENTATGDLISTNILQTDDIELRLSGTGDIDLGLDADDIIASIYGTGDIRLEGVADQLDLRSTGTGDFLAFPLTLNRAEIELTGAGDAEVFVRDYLDVRITGTGDVFFRGTPRIDSRITGTGRVRDAN